MKTYYAINLNGEYSGTSRWALYQMGKDGELEVVWCTLADGKRQPLLPKQVYSKRKEYPAYHFVSTVCGLSHISDVADSLSQHFKEEVRILELNGYAPSLTIANYRSKK